MRGSQEKMACKDTVTDMSPRGPGPALPVSASACSLSRPRFMPLALSPSSPFPPLPPPAWVPL